jgi:hypothetical protein
MESFQKRKTPYKTKSKSPSKLSTQTALKRSLSQIFEKETNFEKDSKINLQYISGPITWTGFDFGNKAVHFFGDRHFSREFNCEDYYDFTCSNSKDFNPNSICMTIDGLIRAIFETSDKRGFYADFFLESPYQTKKIKPRKKTESSSIGYFADVYDYNIERINSGIINSKTKFHPIDIRSDWTICDRRTKKCERMCLDLFTYISLLLIQSKDESDLTRKSFGDDIVDLFQNGSLDYYKSDNYILFIKNLIKQLSDWENKTSLHQEFLIKLDKILKHLTAYGIGGKSKNLSYQSIKMLESLNKKEITFKGVNISEYIQEFFEKQKNQYYNQYLKNQSDLDLIFLLEIGASLMDISTLTKIFKRMANDEPQVLIVFAGNDHIKSYVNFFTEILGLKPLPGSISSKKENHMRCLEDPNFSTIFAKWIEETPMERGTKKKKSNESSPKERKKKSKTVIATPRKSKRIYPSPRKSKRISKPVQRFSQQNYI